MKSTKRITNEPLFTQQNSNVVKIEQDFVPLDTSCIWALNSLFWKNYDVWVKTYNEAYQDALPTKKSYSHDPEFIEYSARRFFSLLERLQTQNKLPEQILVLEQGPGTGEYAHGFLNFMEKWSNKKNPFYDRLKYLLSDESQVMLDEAKTCLKKHKNSTLYITQKDLYHVTPIFTSKILFIRHGNLWDQLPCRMFMQKNAKIYELYVRAVLDKKIARSTVIAQFMHGAQLEKFVTKHPKKWKTIMQSIKLETTYRHLSNIALQAIPHYKVLERIFNKSLPHSFITMSAAVLENIENLSTLVDWERGGYMEVVDLVAKDYKDMTKAREPMKFDGTIAMCVNGQVIKEFAELFHNNVSYRKLKYLNTVVTVRKQNLENLLENEKFVITSEIAARQGDSPHFLSEKMKAFSSNGADIVTFSDQAHGWDSFLSIEDLLNQNVFPICNPRNLLPVFATRRKTWKTIHDLILKLKQEQIQQLFVVTGDPSTSDNETGISSIEALPVLSKHFFTGAVAKANSNDIPRLIEKINAGARFFIVQSNYDTKMLEKWVREIKKLKLHKTSHFIMSLIPIISRKTIDALADFSDVPVSKDIQNRFSTIQEEKIKSEGIKLSKELINLYLSWNVFKGIYIFTRSKNIMKELGEYARQNL